MALFKFIVIYFEIIIIFLAKDIIIT